MRTTGWPHLACALGLSLLLAGCASTKAGRPAAAAAEHGASQATLGAFSAVHGTPFHVAQFGPGQGQAPSKLKVSKTFNLLFLDERDLSQAWLFEQHGALILSVQQVDGVPQHQPKLEAHGKVQKPSPRHTASVLVRYVDEDTNADGALSHHDRQWLAVVDAGGHRFQKLARVHSHQIVSSGPRGFVVVAQHDAESPPGAEQQRPGDHFALAFDYASWTLRQSELPLEPDAAAEDRAAGGVTAKQKMSSLKLDLPDVSDATSTKLLPPPESPKELQARVCASTATGLPLPLELRELAPLSGGLFALLDAGPGGASAQTTHLTSLGLQSSAVIDCGERLVVFIPAASEVPEKKLVPTPSVHLYDQRVIEPAELSHALDAGYTTVEREAQLWCLWVEPEGVASCVESQLHQDEAPAALD